jgi:purine-binding chemotaxis protein CheW
VSERDVSYQLDDLRRAFDQAFAVPPPPPLAELESLLIIRVDGESFALRVGELAGLEGRRKIVALPLDAPAFLGLAGMKGQLVPVYSLASLLGYAGEGTDEGRWLAVCGAGDPVGLAFPALQGYVRIAPSALSALGEAERGRGHVQGVLRLASETCYVLSVPSILAEINRRTSRPGAAQEE